MEITQLLQRIQDGDREALNEVIPLVYAELKKLAATHLRRESGPVMLETTALVHEAFLRMAKGRHPAYENRSHFYGVASRLMRQILVEMARARDTGKRGAPEEPLRTDHPDKGWQSDRSLLALDDALTRLASEDELKARLIEMHYFGGMTAEESSEALSLSVHMIRRHLRLAQAWLRKELASGRA
jgi:RNA polymerase sigma factor (TIGR02999 family)